MPGFRDLRSNHDFTVLWLGSTISQLGSSLSTFAFPLLTFALTGSAAQTSLVAMMEYVGILATLLPAGAWADRYDRRLLMRVATGTGALAYASLVVADAVHHLTPVHLAVVSLVSGAAVGLFEPAEGSAVRAVVPAEQLPAALSQNQARQWIASLLGSPVGGLLYGLGRLAPFAFDAVSYAVDWVLLGLLRTDLAHPAGERRDDGPSGWASVVAGWRFMLAQPFLRTLGLWSPLANVTVNAVFFLAELRLIRAGFPAWQIGLSGAAVGVAGLLGALAAPWILERVRTGHLALVAAWAFVPLSIPLAFWNSPAMVALAASVGVFFNPAGNAGIGAYAQAITPRGMQGRFGAVRNFTSMSLFWLAPVLGGFLLAALPGRDAVLVLGALCAAVALIPTLSRGIRSVPRAPVWQAELAEAAALSPRATSPA